MCVLICQVERRSLPQTVAIWIVRKYDRAHFIIERTLPFAFLEFGLLGASSNVLGAGPTKSEPEVKIQLDRFWMLGFF
ncbi:hypothetical protein CA13_16890 [Planctomycetes bacterium CA13]|uniref:Uncharacterized protein n=1 Tax=Novipirellula herctigrandis TaxID=2527986 RepID=A0A5C5YZU0_9BACT|nr:hypothetical protein CA13_16890 [Planctomycetes bacterium CA13]